MWKRGVTDEAPLLKEYEGDKQTHQTGLEEGRDRSYPEGLNCGRTSRWGSRIRFPGRTGGGREEWMDASNEYSYSPGDASCKGPPEEVCRAGLMRTIGGDTSMEMQRQKD
ncbi:unnamed protein product [Leuciscus chuanchicus]